MMASSSNFDNLNRVKKSIENEHLQAKSMKAELEKRRQSTKEALHIVTELIEPGICKEQLLAAIPKLNRQYYSDVIEERRISLICGYPLCKGKLMKVQPQKYKISLKEKKVYDMEERNKFCSEFCYKASKFCENQISTEPLWARSPDTAVQLLERSVDNSNDSMRKSEHLLFAEQLSDLSIRGESSKTGESQNMQHALGAEHINGGVISSTENTITSGKLQLLTHTHSQADKGTQDHLIGSIQERITPTDKVDTTNDGAKAKSNQTSESLNDVHVNVDVSSDETFGIAGSGTSKSITEVTVHRLQDWLTSQTTEYLTTGYMPVQRQTLVNPQEDDACGGSEDRKASSDEIIISNPAVASAAKQRQKIVLHRISKSLSVVKPLIEGYCPEPRRIKTLVDTFKLTRENIVLRACEWHIITLFLIALLMRTNPECMVKVKVVLSTMIPDNVDEIISYLMMLYHLTDE